MKTYNIQHTTYNFLRLFLFVVGCSSLVVSLHLALAAPVAGQYDLPNPLGSPDLISLLQKIIQGLIALAIPLAAGMVVWAGMLYIFGAADPGLVTKATHALTYTVIGFTVLLLSSGVVSIIQDALGVTVTPACPASAVVCTFQDVVKALTNISGWLFVFAAIAGSIMIIVAGLAYVFAGGDSAKASKATKMIIYSLIGVVVAGLAWSLINVVSTFFTGSAAFSLFANNAYAAPIPRPTQAPTGGPSSLQEVLDYLTSISGWLFVFTIIFAVIMIIIGGISYVFAYGDSPKAGKATKMIIYSLIGVVVAGLAWSLINVVSTFFTGSAPFSLLPQSVYAAGPPAGPSPLIRPSVAPSGVSTFQEVVDLLTQISGWLFVFAVIGATIAIIVAGLMYLTSAGDSGRVSKATKTILFALVGVAVAGFAWAVLNVVGNIIFGKPFFATLGGNPPQAFTCPGAAPGDEGREVLMIGGECYPKSQFSISITDVVCKDPHYHSSIAVVSLDGTTINDPAPGDCGFGKVSDIPSGAVKL